MNARSERFHICSFSVWERGRRSIVRTVYRVYGNSVEYRMSKLVVGVEGEDGRKN